MLSGQMQSRLGGRRRDQNDGLHSILAQLQRRRRRSARARKGASKFFVRHATTKTPPTMPSSTRTLATSSQKRARDLSTPRRTTKPQKDPQSQCIMESGSQESENHSLFGSRETQVSRFKRVRIQRTRHYQTTSSGNENKDPASGYHNWLTALSHNGTDSPITQERKKENWDGITALSIPLLWKDERVAEGTKVRALGLHLKIRQSPQESTVRQPHRIRGKAASQDWLQAVSIQEFAGSNQYWGVEGYR
jgi:hypothetical protein